MRKSVVLHDSNFELPIKEIKKIKIRAQKTFIRYYKWFLVDAISVEDIEQELLLVSYETIKKYKNKNLDEIIKLVQNRVSWKIHELVRNAKITSAHFNLEDIDELEKDKLLEEIHDKTTYSKFLQSAYSNCTSKEYKLLQRKFAENKTFRELAKIYGVSRQRIEQRYSKLLKKLKKKWCRNIKWGLV